MSSKELAKEIPSLQEMSVYVDIHDLSFTGSEVEVRLYYECIVIHKLLTSGSIHRRQEHKLPR